jgi:hypothetical protein
MRLIVNYFKANTANRQAEIDNCLINNFKVFEDIEVIVDDYSCKLPININPKYIHYRPTFDVLFSYAKAGKWNVFCNSDIYFDETIHLIKHYNIVTFFALSRWDVNGNSTDLLNSRDAQDSWAFFGESRIKNAKFYQGVPGCDNKLAYLAEDSGYDVVNPAKTIKSYHLHESKARDYNASMRVPEPYKLIYPHE